MKKSVKHLTLCAILGALSIVINVITRQLMPSEQFMIPLFVLPLIIGSILLGPVTGGMMGLVVDIASFFIGGGINFLPLMTLSRVMWGVLPFFFYYQKNKIILLVGIFLTHLIATAINSLALFIAFNVGMIPFISARLAMLPVNVVVLTFLTIIIISRLPEEIQSLIKNSSYQEQTNV